MKLVADVSLMGETFANFVTSRRSVLLGYAAILHLKHIPLLRRHSRPASILV